jgi:hypothetical protein
MTAMRWMLAGICLVCGGCVQRFLTVKSDPPGALVTLNGMEVGRTPMTRSFTWYGNYDVELRKPGYETLKTHAAIIAPWWQWVPIDLLAEMMPFHPTDRQSVSFNLKPASTQPVDPQAMLKEANQLRSELEKPE